MKLNKYTKSILLVIILALTPQVAFTQTSDPSMAEQLRTMKYKVEQLEAALDLKEKKIDTQKMKAMRKMKAMQKTKTMQKKSMRKMKAMQKKSMMKKGMSMKGVDMKMMGAAPAMGMMGKMKGMSMSKSSLPGFPGASHIYHIGSTGFFLDHPEHITLTTDQQIQLNTLMGKSLASSATQKRNIEQAEQELWKLTSSDTPNIKKIETKIQAISKMQTDQRIAFIRAIGKAASLLTKEQRLALSGTTMKNGNTSNPKTPEAPKKEDHKDHEGH